ncbi:unnamed protein product [Ixodes hexagonus]
MRSDTPPRMDDLNDHSGTDDDDVPGELDDDIEIIEFYEGSDDSDSDEADHDAEGETTFPEPSRNDAVTTFREHTGSVFACAVSADAKHVVSGGEDDRGYVWSLQTGETLFQCTGHKDSVTCVGFNYDSTLVATGDMSGLIRVWSVAAKELVWEFETSDLSWLEWHQAANVLLVGTADGSSWLWKIPSGDCKTLQSFGPASSAGKILPDGKRAVTAYEDGTFRLWDLKGGSVTHAVTGGNAHNAAVTCLDCSDDLIATGSMDGGVKLTNAGNGKVLASLRCDGDASGDSANSVETVGLDPSVQTLAVGMLSGDLGLWDVGTLVQKQGCPHPAGVVKLLWKGPNCMVTACLDSVVRAWDTRSGQTVCSWEGHRAEILDVALAPDGQSVVTASEDGTCAIYKWSQD